MTTPNRVPSVSPSVSPGVSRAPARRVCPPIPSPSEGDTLSEPAATVSHNRVPVPLWDVLDARACRECGCTENNACHPPCWWVEYDLCSTCQGRRPIKVYIDRRDWWVGYYRGDTHHYVCPFPCLVIRWPRRAEPMDGAR